MVASMRWCAIKTCEQQPVASQYRVGGWVQKVKPGNGTQVVGRQAWDHKHNTAETAWEIDSPDTEQQQQNTTDQTLNEALPAHHMPRGLGHQGEQAARRSQQVFASVSLQY